MPAIDESRLLGDLRALARIGACGTGVERIALSEVDLAARRWLAERLRDAGLAPVVDRCGTVLGRAPEASRAVLVGSHTDTVPRGGWLDGSLGVIYALEIARTLRAAGLPAVDVVSFQDEEGSFVPCLGSRLFTGELDEAGLAGLPGPGGAPLPEVFRSLALAERFERLDRARHAAYFEAHIEQGPRLEAAGIAIGVVTGIVGIRRVRVEAKGEANHAGTTPMAMRRDAGRALITLAARLPELVAREGGPDTVWNIGVMSFAPGAANVVPAAAGMVVEMRDLDPAVLDRLERALAAEVRAADGAHGVAVSLAPAGAVAPTQMDAALIGLLESAARDLGARSMRLPSGAGHDAMILGRAIPSAMLFVPSIGGRSHDVTEDTRTEDIVLGCQVLCNAVAAAVQRERA